MSVAALDRKERPAYVTFHRVAMQDNAATLAAGRYVAKDVDYAHITPAYSKDVMKHKVSDWFTKMEQDVIQGRIPQDWLEQYKKHYQAWQNGQELPLSGVPIKGWGVISPAQQETLTRMNILTVEDLAGINDDGIRRIGMGAVDLKNKAVAWLQSMNDSGKLVVENAALKQEVSLLAGSVESLTTQVEELTKLVRLQRNVEVQETISADDIIEPVKRGPGRPRKE